MILKGKLGKAVFSSLSAVALSGVLASGVYADSAKAEGVQKQQKLVKISTLNSIEANQEFQRNVQVMQAQRQRLQNLQIQMQKAHTDELKAELQKQIDASLEKLNEDNKRMVKAYGFSLSRNYVLVAEKAHVYMAVTDAEAAKIKEKEESEK